MTGGTWWRRSLNTAHASTYTLSVLLASLFIAWQCLAQVDFLYRLWYPIIGINVTITEYGPKNIHRRDFQTTTREEHQRLFGRINQAVHAQGRGLADIIYLDSRGKAVDRLLTPAEITHLEDVARLIDRFTLAGWMALLVWAALLSWSSLHCRPLPSARQSLQGLLLTMGICGLLVLVIGPVKTFYALHEWIFPAGHQWFFYYEESLMTMLMQAPDLFAYIGLAWLALGISVFALSLKLSAHLHGSRCQSGRCGS